MGRVTLTLMSMSLVTHCPDRPQPLVRRNPRFANHVSQPALPLYVGWRRAFLRILLGLKKSRNSGFGARTGYWIFLRRLTFDSGMVLEGARWSGVCNCRNLYLQSGRIVAADPQFASGDGSPDRSRMGAPNR